MPEDPFIRQRPLSRAATLPVEPPSAPHGRRSSLHSISSAQDSLRGSADDLWTPRPYEDHEQKEHSEVTNWHSLPLVFALVPAVAGLVIQDGAKIFTDVLLLGLASVFLNWSVKLPWFVVPATISSNLIGNGITKRSRRFTKKMTPRLSQNLSKTTM
jgi:hypothetical protein